jgi:hypothetical protein
MAACALRGAPWYDAERARDDSKGTGPEIAYFLSAALILSYPSGLAFSRRQVGSS